MLRCLFACFALRFIWGFSADACGIPFGHGAGKVLFSRSGILVRRNVSASWSGSHVQFCLFAFPLLCTASWQQFVQRRCWPSSHTSSFFTNFPFSLSLSPILTTQCLFSFPFLKACHDNKAVLFFNDFSACFFFFNYYFLLSLCFCRQEGACFMCWLYFGGEGAANCCVCVLYSLFLELRDRHRGIPRCTSPSVSL